MKVSIICCPFKTSYGAYSESLKKAIERKTGAPVDWVASNCGCGDPVEVNRQFQTQGYRYFEMINVPDYYTSRRWRLWLRLKARSLVYYFRARKYRELSKDSEVVHFQQTLNAYGSNVAFHWLNQPSRAARVVTVHELDSHQKENREKNKIYNKADAIIVHQGAIKDELIGLGVDPRKIELVLHGTDLPELNAGQVRECLIFYGGHFPMKGKGLVTLFEALVLLRKRMGSKSPKLKVHGHFGMETPEEARAKSRELGIENEVIWLNQISHREIFKQYQSSLICVLPYQGSFAGLPATVAAATELPVIATRKAGVPEHLGDCAVWIDGPDPTQLADRIEELLKSEILRTELSKRLRKRAEDCLAWDLVADRTLEIYRKALANQSK